MGGTPSESTGLFQIYVPGRDSAFFTTNKTPARYQRMEYPYVFTDVADKDILLTGYQMAKISIVEVPIGATLPIYHIGQNVIVKSGAMYTIPEADNEDQNVTMIDLKGVISDMHYDNDIWDYTLSLTPDNFRCEIKTLNVYEPSLRLPAVVEPVLITKPKYDTETRVTILAGRIIWLNPHDSKEMPVTYSSDTIATCKRVEYKTMGGYTDHYYSILIMIGSQKIWGYVAESDMIPIRVFKNGDKVWIKDEAPIYNPHSKVMEGTIKEKSANVLDTLHQDVDGEWMKVGLYYKIAQHPSQQVSFISADDVSEY